MYPKVHVEMYHGKLHGRVKTMINVPLTIQADTTSLLSLYVCHSKVHYSQSQHLFLSSTDKKWTVICQFQGLWPNDCSRGQRKVHRQPLNASCFSLAMVTTQCIPISFHAVTSAVTNYPVKYSDIRFGNISLDENSLICYLKNLPKQVLEHSFEQFSPLKNNTCYSSTDRVWECHLLMDKSNIWVIYHIR